MSELVAYCGIESDAAMDGIERELIELEKEGNSRVQLTKVMGSNRVELAACDSQDFAVLMIGLDNFTALNDTLGRSVANEVLQLCGQRLQSALGEQGSLTRLPGGEFAILLNPVLPAFETGTVAERLADLLHRSYFVHGQVANITACIGIAVASEGDRHPETLLKRAGMALQGARSAGPGTVQFFEIAMEERIVARHALTLDLGKVLLLHQLEVHYQPQVDIEIQQLTGFEALLRWRHPRLGWIPPAEFIPLAEETGLIGMIGDWVLRTACQQAARLPEEIVVAVNASPLQFRSGSFPASVGSALTMARIPACRLEIEVTEGVLLEDSKAVLATLNELHSMGVRLAMDDFGTGYSSLGQLASLPFDTIKIDRSLVGAGAKQRAIVRAISTLGNGLGMSTLVEGIETEQQLGNAYVDGCTLAQGFLFGRAVPASELESLIARFSSHFFSAPERSYH